VDLALMLRYSRRGLAEDDDDAGEPSPTGSGAPVPSLTY
jgi:hypothetical protein